MARLVIDHNKVTDVEAFLKLCPFGALEAREGRIEANAACKLCKLCIKNGPPGAAFLLEEQETPKADKASWNGIAVYVDHNDGVIHPVTFELIGKARELAGKVHQPVFAVFLGSGITSNARELLHYGVDEVYVYDHPALERFRIEAYAGAFETFIKRVRPSSILVGATTVGRQLAPRVAARMRTGLTADCTVLDIRENTDLVQIRPAFGGNIMAQILTPNHRPQMATVRYKVMDAPTRSEAPSGEITERSVTPAMLESGVTVLGVTPKEPEQFIEGVDVLVAAGRGVKKEEDLALLEELAELLGGQLACTRPLAENGWVEAKRQVGLSGRTVRPRLIITCGVSGAVQFVAGMQGADLIVAINQDEKAPIFKTAHYGLVGDLYEIVPRLIERIKAAKGVLV